MGTWNGWAEEFLTAATLPDSQANKDFLNEWASHANTDCNRNPIDVSHRVANSTSCHSLPSGLVARNYPSHAAAAGAFADQVTGGAYPHLLKALGDGQPFGSAVGPGVEADLLKWGSTKFAAFYEHPTLGGPGGGITLPSGMKGLSVVQHTLARDVPTALKASSILRRRALRYLGAPRNLR